MVKILIVEDQILMRDLLEELIGKQPDMKVIEAISDSSKTLQLCCELKPDLVLMDIVTKNGCSGIHFAAQIIKKLPEIKIVLMTSYHEITFIDEARKAGVHSYLYKSSGKDHLLYVIRSTMNGTGIYPGPADVSFLINRFKEKELAVIRLVCQGMARNEIAEKLNVSESMIKQHIASILDKSGFDSISKFAIYAVGQGLIVPDDTPGQKSN